MYLKRPARSTACQLDFPVLTAGRGGGGGSVGGCSECSDGVLLSSARFSELFKVGSALILGIRMWMQSASSPPCSMSAGGTCNHGCS